MRKVLFAGAYCALFFVLVNGISSAADASQQTGSILNIQKAKTQTTIPTARPVAPDIRIDLNRIKIVQLQPFPYSELEAAMEQVKRAAVEWKYVEGSADWQSKKCAEKSYNAADQQAAGCLGSDIVDICSQKLYQHCMQTSVYRTSYMDRLKKMMDAVDNLTKKSSLYRNGLNDAEKKFQ